MIDATWHPGVLYSEKRRGTVDVEYQCEAVTREKFTIWIRPRVLEPSDPSGEVGFQATFVIEAGGFIRATMLDRNGFRSLEGVCYDLFKQVGAHTGRAVRSSLLLHVREVAEDGDDQLQDSGPRMWNRFEADGRAWFDAEVRRFFFR